MKGGLIGIEGGEREEGRDCGQDGEQFEDCLRRCQAIEQKLTQQVNSFNLPFMGPDFSPRQINENFP